MDGELHFGVENLKQLLEPAVAGCGQEGLHHLALLSSGACRLLGGDTDERLHNVAAWREAPFYTDAERAALALAEAATRLQDGAPGVTDEIWEEVNAHFTEEQIGAINLEIALTNFFNRINRTIKEPAGKTWG
ncbi:alkylhydroperoxidase [Streptomyces sp. NPDC003996]